jgi:hypothetical protein
MYCRGSPDDLRWTMSCNGSLWPLATARCIHLSSLAACEREPTAAVSLVSIWFGMV